MDAAYPQCSHVKKLKMSDIDIPNEVIEKSMKDFNVLPLFEKEMSDCIMKEYTSLENNEFLRCRWQAYVDRGGRKSGPLSLKVDFNRFKNHKVEFDPEAANKKKCFRNHLKPGPGVDYYGILPIPSDMQLRKTVSIKKTKNVKTKKVKLTEAKSTDVKLTDEKVTK